MLWSMDSDGSRGNLASFAATATDDDDDDDDADDNIVADDLVMFVDVVNA